MAVNSSVPVKRSVMSHEFGHYMFCSMMQEQNSEAINWVILQAIADSKTTNPLRYANEAVADFFNGQVAGGADYGWAKPENGFTAGYSNYCAPQQSGTALNPSPTDLIQLAGKAISRAFPRKIRTRIASAELQRCCRMQSTIPRQFAVRCGSNQGVLGLGRTACMELFPLTFSPRDYLKPDFENVSIGGSGIRTFSHNIAGTLVSAPGLTTVLSVLEAVGSLASLAAVNGALGAIDSNFAIALSDAKIYRALNDTMRAPAHGGASWCERCAVLATHKREGVAETGWTPALFEQCKNDALLSGALNQAPPDASLNINRTTCSACPAGTVRNADFSACDPCNGVIVGNECRACQPDVVIDGATLLPGTTLTIPSTTPQVADDRCPNVLWVEVRNVPAVFSAHPDTVRFGAELLQNTTPAECAAPHTWYRANQSGTSPYVYSTSVATGTWSCSGSGLCPEGCTGLPTVSVVPSNVPFTNMQFGVSAGGLDDVIIRAVEKPIIVQ